MDDPDTPRSSPMRPRDAASQVVGRAPRRSREEMRWVFYRRRTMAGGSTLLVVWLVLQALGGLVGTVTGGDDPAEAALPARTPSDAAPATTTTEPPCPPPGERFAEADEEVPAELTAAVDAALAAYGFTRYEAGLSVWIDGYGEVVAENGDEPLVPASNQKILTAMGVLELLDPDSRLTTELRTSAPVTDGGVVQGDLVIVGGGDPLIKRTGPHSIEDIVAELADEGITRIEGDVVGDESRYDQVRKAPGWLEWEMPLPGGAMSALMVNSNSRLGDDEYLANPTMHNAELLVAALEDAGIEVEGSAAVGTAETDSEVVLAYPSPTVAEMVHTMLRESDNMAAEMLAKEVGLQVSGEGSTVAGMTAIVEGLEEALCLTIDGVNDDASGISRDNRRSAETWRQMLLAATEEPWFDLFYNALPVAGEEGGTLATRLLGTDAVGNVHAKTGTIGTGVGLSGYAETEGGRPMVFSMIVNGDQPEGYAVPAIDALVVALQADPG